MRTSSEVKQTASIEDCFPSSLKKFPVVCLTLRRRAALDALYDVYGQYTRTGGNFYYEWSLLPLLLSLGHSTGLRPTWDEAHDGDAD